MPNLLSNTGLQVKTNAEIVAALTTALQGIYGSDINVSQNSPDGQMIAIYAQAALDNLELLDMVYQSFSVDNAFGRTLDLRVALNGLVRKGGTYTTTLVAFVINRAVNLVGLDGRTTPDGTEFTVADDSGNQFVLLASESFAGAGTYGRTFRAVDPGAILVTRNTITNQVKVVLGITQVYNPDDPDGIGTDEENDAQIKTRHARSFWLASTGPVDAVQAALLNISGVTDAFVAENFTAAVLNGVPAHGIWCIVEGGTAAEIGAAIYAKKAPGCDMRGGSTYTVARPASNMFTAKFDRPILQNLYVKFGLNARVSGTVFDNAQIATDLVAALIYTLNQQANIGDVVAAMLEIAPTAYLTSVGVSSDGITYLDNATPVDAQHKFILATARVTIS